MEEIKSFGFVPERRWWVARFTYRWRWNLNYLKREFQKGEWWSSAPLLAGYADWIGLQTTRCPNILRVWGMRIPCDICWWELHTPFQLRGKGRDPNKTKQNKQTMNEQTNEWMNGENQPLHCLCLISMCFWSTYLDGSSRESKCYKNHCGSH